MMNLCCRLDLNFILSSAYCHIFCESKITCWYRKLRSVSQDFAHHMWQECSAVVQGSLLRCIWRGAILAAGQNLHSFQCSWERCGCIRWTGICLDPRLHSYLHPTSQFTCMVQFVLPESTCCCFSYGHFLKNYCPSHPMPFCQCPSASKMTQGI